MTGDGSRLRYDKLLLATGATPRRLTVPGSNLEGLHYLRSLDDSDRLGSSLSTGGRVAIIGGGWIGLETAAARSAGSEVTVLERAELPLLRVLGPQVARVFADLHTDHGVDLRCGVTVTGIRPATADRSAAGTVLLADGTELHADVIIVGVGASPNVELARTGGLTVDDDIVVDEHLRTSDPDIVAAGDVANAYHPLLGRRIRVEHWANALRQPATAAMTMLGHTATYAQLPYFLHRPVRPRHGVHQVHRSRRLRPGRPSRRHRCPEFIAFWLHDGRVLAGMNVNIWAVTEPIKQMIESGERVDPTRLADPDVPLARLARS